MRHHERVHDNEVGADKFAQVLVFIVFGGALPDIIRGVRGRVPKSAPRTKAHGTPLESSRAESLTPKRAAVMYHLLVFGPGRVSNTRNPWP